VTLPMPTAGEEQNDVLGALIQGAFLELAAESSPPGATRHPNLLLMLNEVDAWLADKRSYDKRPRTTDWQSMILDLNSAATGRGSRLRSLTPSVDSLVQALHDRIGTDCEARTAALRLSHLAREELKTEGAATAGFDDLLQSLKRSEPRSMLTIQRRLQSLNATLQAADKPTASLAWMVAGIAANSAWDVASAAHILDGVEMPGVVHSSANEHAGLTLDERIDLSRRLMQYVSPPGNRVVWLAYGNATLESLSRIDCGPATFFNGRTLLGQFAMIAECKKRGQPLSQRSVDGRALDTLPPELLDEQFGEHVRDPQQWPREDHWVAVRVDLGDRPSSTGTQAAVDVAESLINAAALEIGESSWQRLQGSSHFVDGKFRGGGHFFAPGKRDRIGSDNTGDALEVLSKSLKGNFPFPTGSDLHDLAAAAAASQIIHANRGPDDATLARRSGRRTACFPVLWSRVGSADDRLPKDRLGPEPRFL
jgi:hypothetical protein